jgi:hypothetical protein
MLGAAGDWNCCCRKTRRGRGYIQLDSWWRSIASVTGPLHECLSQQCGGLAINILSRRRTVKGILLDRQTQDQGLELSY